MMRFLVMRLRETSDECWSMGLGGVEAEAGGG